MSKSTKDIIEIFIDLIEKGLCPDETDFHLMLPDLAVINEQNKIL